MVRMRRREVLRLLATGAALQLAPGKLLAVAQEARKMLESQAARALNAHQAATVKTLAELILPRTNTPGATDVGAVEFIDLILMEWYDDGERARFLAGIADVDLRAQKLFGKDFVDCSAMQQSEILTALGEKMVSDLERSRSRGEEFPEEMDFYPRLRQLALTAYFTSEAGATQELHFEIIPDRYQGCETDPLAKK